MKAVVQRVKCASVKVDGALKGEIEAGLLVLLGVEKTDTDTDAEILAGKLSVKRERMQQKQAVLAAGNADSDAVARSNHFKIGIRLADTAQNSLHHQGPPVFLQR